MAEYIDRDAFIKDKQEWYCSNCEKRKGIKNGKMCFIYGIGDAPCRACGIDDMLSDIEDYQIADVKPVVRGKWIEHYKCNERGENKLWYYQCSNCGAVSTTFFFCPNCGADMRGNDND